MDKECVCVEEGGGGEGVRCHIKHHPSNRRQLIQSQTEYSNFLFTCQNIGRTVHITISKSLQCLAYIRALEDSKVNIHAIFQHQRGIGYK